MTFYCRAQDEVDIPGVSRSTPCLARLRVLRGFSSGVPAQQDMFNMPAHSWLEHITQSYTPLLMADSCVDVVLRYRRFRVRVEVSTPIR